MKNILLALMVFGSLGLSTASYSQGLNPPNPIEQGLASEYQSILLENFENKSDVQISTSLLFMHFPHYVCLAWVRFQLRRKGAINTQIEHIDAFYYQLFEREADERNKVDKCKSTHRGTGDLRKLKTLTQFLVCSQKTTNKQKHLCKLQKNLQIYAEKGEKSTKVPPKNLHL